MDDIVPRLRELLDGPVPMSVERQDVRDAAGEIEQLRREVLELRGVVRAHESMYARAAEEIDRLRAIVTRQGIQLIVAHSEAAGMYEPNDD